MKLSFNLNGRPIEVECEHQETLAEVLRERLNLTGTKISCEVQVCGACTVLVDGKAVNSCLVLAVELDGAGITTIEGIGSPDRLHPLQQAFIDHGVVQCGFCLPGMTMAAKSLLDEEPNPTEKDIRAAIAGNLCRCTGYVTIVKAITAASRTLRGASKR